MEPASQARVRNSALLRCSIRPACYVAQKSPPATFNSSTGSELELAKAIASNAKLLLLDEIASGLTDHEVVALVELIAELKANHAIVWIEHIPHALRAVADQIMVLHFGRKVLDGTPTDVMTSPIVREIYMGLSADAA